MKEVEFAKIHSALWSEHPPRTVQYRGRRFRVNITTDATRDFRSVQVDDLLIITQNLKKSSKMTTWVKKAQGRKITWIIKNNDYIGCAKTWVEKNEEHTQITHLKTDEVLLHDTHAA